MEQKEIESENERHDDLIGLMHQQQQQRQQNFQMMMIQRQQQIQKQQDQQAEYKGWVIFQLLNSSLKWITWSRPKISYIDISLEE